MRIPQRNRTNSHQQYLKPHARLLYHSHPTTLDFKVLSQIFLIDHSLLKLGLNKLLVEHDWVLEVLPDTLKVVLEYYGEDAHKRDDCDDQICEEAFFW